jgi:PilZ domain
VQIAVKKRSLTPTLGVPLTEGGVHPMRRGGTRSEVTERIVLLPVSNAGSNTGGRVGAPAAGAEKPFDGWALNVSRGGVRCILEEKVELGAEYDVTIGAEGDAPLTRRGRIVWIQEEADGSIVGIEFMNLSGTHRSVPPVAGPGTDGPDGGPRKE